jgi:hypothetical protein
MPQIKRIRSAHFFSLGQREKIVHPDFHGKITQIKRIRSAWKIGLSQMFPGQGALLIQNFFLNPLAWY